MHRGSWKEPMTWRRRSRAPWAILHQVSSVNDHEHQPKLLGDGQMCVCVCGGFPPSFLRWCCFLFSSNWSNWPGEPSQVCPYPMKITPLPATPKVIEIGLHRMSLHKLGRFFAFL
uniref:Uncharacterized protein n=1 Tax=Micrurus lemniscatus lemniscatus TaxID=129467 RepID=A0A2D4HSA2_MICLE